MKQMCTTLQRITLQYIHIGMMYEYLINELYKIETIKYPHESKSIFTMQL